MTVPQIAQHVGGRQKQRSGLLVTAHRHQLVNHQDEGFFLDGRVPLVESGREGKVVKQGLERLTLCGVEAYGREQKVAEEGLKVVATP